MRRCALALFFLMLTAPLAAIEPDEILEDPVLEARAREISQGLRCPVCQNESIDESRVPVAKDLRLLVRERLLAGDSDAQTLQYIVDRYGEFVLLKPDTGGANLVLWLAGPLTLVLVAGGFLLARRQREAEAPLSDQEKARLAALLSDEAER
ncbi:MAG: cytochrome c-type biogenesis protein [Pseudomonadota bacterium]